MSEDPGTWAELKTSLREWCDKDTDGISDDRLEECIALAERHFQRELYTPDRETAFSVTANAQSEALPSDFGGFKSPPYVDGDQDNRLIKLTPDELRAMYPGSATGTPRHYAIEGENILFGPTPSGDTDIKGTYYATIAPLNAGTTTNWLLTDHADLYIAGSLAEIYRFLRDTEAQAIETMRRDGMIAAINKVGVRRSNSGPLVASTGVRQISHIRA